MPLQEAAIRGLALQKALARLVSPLSLLAVYGFLRLVLGLRLADAAAARRAFRELADEDDPLLICANHLTMIDSALVAWALGSPGWYFLNFRRLAWSTSCSNSRTPSTSRSPTRTSTRSRRWATPWSPSLPSSAR